MDNGQWQSDENFQIMQWTLSIDIQSEIKMVYFNKLFCKIFSSL